MRDRIVRYIDKGAVAAAMADQHTRERIDWGCVLGWLASIGFVVAFWWWALFC